MSDDGIPHGLKGYRSPYNCKCKVCRAAWAEYCQGRRQARKDAEVDDLARKRRQKGRRARPVIRSESSDSQPEDPKPTVGDMELAVIAECAAMEKQPNATQLVAAKRLASLIDKLSQNEDGVGASVINSSTKQLMAIMSEMRGDTLKSKATGRRKSGGRLATVGSMTKVKRQGA